MPVHRGPLESHGKTVILGSSPSRLERHLRKMSQQIRHFVLTPEGGIREFTSDQAAGIAAGASRLPEFANHDLRYLQLTMKDNMSSGELDRKSTRLNSSH